MTLPEPSTISPFVREALAVVHQQSLELIVRGASLDAMLEVLCDGIDALDPNLVSSVLLADPDGQRLWPKAGRRVPEDYKQLITPLPIAPSMGACGTAAFRKERVISAGQAALFLVNGGTAVTIVVRGPDLAATMSRYLIDRVEADTRIVVRRNTSIVGLEGDDFLSAVRIDGPTGEERLATTALFSFIGADPASQWLSGSAALDDRGFVLTDRSLGREHLNGAWRTLGRAPLPFETSRPGLFAIGDVRSGSTKRVAAAVGEGSAAVRSVHAYLTFDRH